MKKEKMKKTATMVGILAMFAFAVLTISATYAQPINVSLRADGIAGNIFDVTSYMIQPGNVTEDGVTIDNQTAMGAVVAYCQDNGINVNITMGLYGEYLTQIGNDPADEYNWMYAVNETSPWVGGAQYTLSGGEKVHWYNYMLNYYTVLTTLNKTLINAGDYLNAMVTWKNTSGTYPLSGAEVFVANASYTAGSSVGFTGADGNCTFQWSTPGVWYVYAVDPVHGSGMYNYPPVSFTCEELPTPTPTPTPPVEVPAITPPGFLLASLSLFGLAAIAMRKTCKK